MKDPVCGMDVDPAKAAATSEYEGKTYYFCSGGCKRDFDNDPAGVLTAEEEYDHSKPSEMMTMMEEEPAQASAAGESKMPWWRFWG